MEYRLDAKTRVSKDGSTLIISITVERSEDDGETFGRATVFEHRYSKSVTNIAIIGDVKRRVKEFTRADTNAIASAALSERASNLEDAITGTRIST